MKNKIYHWFYLHQCLNMKNGQTIIYLHQIVQKHQIIYMSYTGYNDHFTWLIKSWNIKGKIVKTQHFINLYQLWKNQITLNFFISDILWYNQIFPNLGHGCTLCTLHFPSLGKLGKLCLYYSISQLEKVSSNFNFP